MPESNTLRTRDSGVPPLIEDPASMEALEAWIKKITAVARAGSFALTTVAYGTHPEQVADLWLPDGPGPFPTVVLIHGGGFLARFSKAIMDANAADLVGRGYAVWCPEYRRTDLDGGPRRTTSDIESALAHLSQIEEPLDLDRVAVVGHSAGGYLALWSAGLTAVRHVIALGAVCDLRINARATADYARFVGGTTDEVPDDYEYLDLSRRPASRSTQVILCGELDQPHRIRENRDYVATAIHKGESITLEELPATGHFAFLDPQSLGWTRAMEALEALRL
ncbi:alpha/beta hydrolase family protein [Nocardioides terrisoli]|uniref:alpha/beta hydrolase family protein n=1 Tax=Nocardioides terrisoli TaxID=3388267 RepID=UPI00287B7D65|nr:alpha/beta fold hydrolase [Nocardioides marmorisolisilvae]